MQFPHQRKFSKMDQFWHNCRPKKHPRTCSRKFKNFGKSLLKKSKYSTTFFDRSGVLKNMWSLSSLRICGANTCACVWSPNTFSKICTNCTATHSYFWYAVEFGNEQFTCPPGKMYIQVSWPPDEPYQVMTVNLDLAYQFHMLTKNSLQPTVT